MNLPVILRRKILSCQELNISRFSIANMSQVFALSKRLFLLFGVLHSLLLILRRVFLFYCVFIRVVSVENQNVFTLSISLKTRKEEKGFFSFLGDFFVQYVNITKNKVVTQLKVS